LKIIDKYVKSACGIVYLGVLKATDEYLLKRGLLKKELPRSVDAYRSALQRHLIIYNGKLLKEFEVKLHIAGYYRGDLRSAGTVKEAFKTAKDFIGKLR